MPPKKEAEPPSAESQKGNHSNQLERTPNETETTEREALMAAVKAASDARRELRKENVLYPEDMKKSTRHLSADVRKNSAFVKRMRGFSDLLPEQKDSMMRELDQLLLKRYTSEIVSAIAQDMQQPDQRAALKIIRNEREEGADDLDRLARMCSKLHQYYDDFSNELYLALMKSTKYEPPSKTVGSSSSGSSGGTSGGTTHATSGTSGSAGATGNSVGSSVGSSSSSSSSSGGTDRFFDHGKVQFALLLSCELFSVGVFDEVGNIYILLRQFINKEGEKRIFPTLNVVLQFMRQYGDIFLRLEQNRVQDNEIRHCKAFFSDEEAIVSDTERNQFREVINKFFKSLCERLYKLHMQLRKMEDDKHGELMGNSVEGKTTTAKEDREAYEKLRKAWFKLYDQVKLLGDYIDTDIPEKIQEGLARIEQMQKEKELETQKQNIVTEHLFDSEETRSFYEDLPNVLTLIEEKNSKRPQEADSKDADAATPKSKIASKIDSMLAKLPKCCSRLMINNWAVEYAILAGKSGKKRLVRTLFGVNRTSLELLPHYSRLVAILQPVYKDLGDQLVAQLSDEFETLFNEKDQIKIENKIKNIKFLGELVKFRICPSSFILNCLERCLNDFTHHNIDVTCALLETCGRFLYVSPDTHERTKEQLEKMMRLREVKALDSKHDTMVQNAYYVSIPQMHTSDDASVSDQWSRLPILQRYVNSLLFEQLHTIGVSRVVRQLRKLPWSTNPNIYHYVIDAIRNNSRQLVKYSGVHMLADVISGISRYHSRVGIGVVDRLLEDIRCALSGEFEIPPQARILDVTLLSELYNYQVLEAKLVFDTLYTILWYCPRKDPPENAFRLRLVCTILDTMGEYLETRAANRRLDRFLLYLQRYILEKQVRLPVDVEFMLADTLENLRPKLKWPKSLKEARQKIAASERRRTFALPCFASGHTINPDYSEQSDQIQPMSTLANADDKVWPIDLQQSAHSRTFAHDDDDHDEDDDQDDQEDDSPSLVDEVDLARERFMQELQKRREAEENELDREFQAMVQDSLSDRIARQQQRQSVPRKIDITNMVFSSSSSQSTGIRGFQQRLQLTRSAGAEDDAQTQASTLKFTLLTQKEKKELDIPDNSRLAMHTKRNMERQEELAARAREFEERKFQEQAREFNQVYARRAFRKGDYYK